MAKFKIEVDIDWLGEDCDLDSTLKEEIADNIINRVQKETIRDISVLAMQKADKVLDKWIDDLVVNTMGTKIPYKKSDWGSKVEMISIEDMLAIKFEKALTQIVDENGKPTNSSYNSYGTRLEWLTGKLANKYVDQRVQEFVKDIKRDVEDYTSKKVKEEMVKQLTASLISNIDFNKVFKEE